MSALLSNNCPDTPAVDIKLVARLLIIAKRMSVRPRWLDELVAHLGDALPAGKPRNPAALVIGGSDANL
jgi:hypothetical protein